MKNLQSYVKEQKNSGITLIALIITIIVLLILAGVTIGMATSNNGIIGKAKQASETWEKAEQNETDALSKLENQMNGYQSNIKEPKINKDTEPPTTIAPTISEITSSGMTITFNQTDANSGIDESAIKYQYKKSINNDWIDSASNKLTDLDSATQYDVRTYAKDNNGNESYSAVVQVTTLESVPTINGKK